MPAASPGEQATDLFSVSTPPLRGDAHQSGHLAAQARQAKSHQHLTSEGKGGRVSDGQDDQVIKLLEQNFGIAGITKFSLDVDYSQSAGVEEAASQSVSAQQGGGQAGSGQAEDSRLASGTITTNPTTLTRRHVWA